MTRTVITLPDELLRKLKHVAKERGVSMAEVIRDSISRTVATHRPKPKSFGIIDSGTTDTARRSADERPVPRTWR